MINSTSDVQVVYAVGALARALYGREPEDLDVDVRDRLHVAVVDVLAHLSGGVL